MTRKRKTTAAVKKSSKSAHTVSDTAESDRSRSRSPTPSNGTSTSSRDTTPVDTNRVQSRISSADCRMDIVTPLDQPDIDLDQTALTPSPLDIASAQLSPLRRPQSQGGHTDSSDPPAPASGGKSRRRISAADKLTPEQEDEFVDWMRDNEDFYSSRRDNKAKSVADKKAMLQPLVDRFGCTGMFNSLNIFHFYS